MLDEPTGLTELELLAQHLRGVARDMAEPLEAGIQAMAAGEFSEPLPIPELHPLCVQSEHPDVRAIVDVCNTMATQLATITAATESLRVQLAAALGERSCLPELVLALRSLNDHCLTDLDRGLQAMADGDLTRSARPYTRPLRSAPGDALGEVGELFNEMLARSRTALRSYDAVREDLRASLGDESSLDDLRTGLRSLQRHCLRDIEEALEAVSEGTALTRSIAPVTEPITRAEEASVGELAELFNRALSRARNSVGHLNAMRQPPGGPTA